MFLLFKNKISQSKYHQKVNTIWDLEIFKILVGTLFENLMFIQ